MARPLHHYRENVHSQNGEDGVIGEILRRLAISDGWCCEFGAWDGIHLSNTFRLIESGWKAVLIESDPAKYLALEATATRYPQIHPINAAVAPSGPYSLDSLLPNTPIPSDFEVLSIDVDGMDLPIWEGVQRYRPKVVVIEVNSSVLPFEEPVGADGSPLPGSSFRTVLRAAREKGYTLVAHTGNMIFVEDGQIEKIGLSRVERALPYLLFDPKWLGPDIRSRLLRGALGLWRRASDVRPGLLARREPRSIRLS